MERLMMGAKRISKLVLVFFAFSMLLHTPFAVSGSAKYLKKGYIQNHNGQDCWYRQSVSKESRHFFGRLTQMVGLLTFDKPSCMTGSGFEMDVNKMMINNIISRWYSHSDAKFKTRVREMYKSSPLQKKGQCIQSSKYPAMGITIDYLIEKDSIKEVIHGGSVSGCSN